MSSIIGTFKLADINPADIIPADVLTVGQGMAMLLSFLNGTDEFGGFYVESSTYNALRRACATYVKQSKSKSTDRKQWRIGDKGKWNNVTKSKSAPRGANVRTVNVKTFTGDDVRAGIATLRDTYNVELGRLAQRQTVDGTECVAVTLRRVEPSPAS